MKSKRRVAATIAAAAMTGLVCGASIALVGGCTSQPGASVTAGGKIAAHDCAGKNNCKGQGGCDSGDNGCRGKNSCRGKGGCGMDMK